MTDGTVQDLVTPENAPATGGVAKTKAPAMPTLGAVAATVSGETSPLSLRQRLERTVTRPLYGTAEGAQEQQRLLQDAARAGTLDSLATQLEQEPVDASRAAVQEVLSARLLAALYEQGGDLDRALSERRRAALLPTADGEDWFELAQTEARLGNTASAQRAYAQALRAAGTPLSPAHRAAARRSLP